MNMASLEDKEKHKQRRSRNYVAKALRGPGDLKGAFAIKVIDPRKGKYVRENIKVKDIINNDDD